MIMIKDMNFSKPSEDTKTTNKRGLKTIKVEFDQCKNLMKLVNAKKRMKKRKVRRISFALNSLPPCVKYTKWILM